MHLKKAILARAATACEALRQMSNFLVLHSQNRWKKNRKHHPPKNLGRNSWHKELIRMRFSFLQLQNVKKGSKKKKLGLEEMPCSLFYYSNSSQTNFHKSCLIFPRVIFLGKTTVRLLSLFQNIKPRKMIRLSS